MTLNKKVGRARSVWSILGMSTFFWSFSVLAETSTIVAVEGTVGNFNAKFVELTLKNGVKVRVPRESLRSSDELRPNQVTAAFVQIDELSLAPAIRR